MRTILVINDNSLEAEHAAKFALIIAQKMQAGVVLANCQNETTRMVETVVTGHMAKHTGIGKPRHSLQSKLRSLNDLSVGFIPAITEVDVSDKDETAIAVFVNKNHVWMMVKGMEITLHGMSAQKTLNIDNVLKKVTCPLLVIPYVWPIANIERVLYIADLRYCRLQVVKYLAEFAGCWQADLSIAHLSAKGLPDIEENYARRIFSEEVCNNVNYDRLFFNNIKEHNITKAVDVIINGMHIDMLALVNHRFHFEKIIGHYLTDVFPEHITIPILVFP